MERTDLRLEAVRCPRINSIVDPAGFGSATISIVSFVTNCTCEIVSATFVGILKKGKLKRGEFVPYRSELPKPSKSAMTGAYDTFRRRFGKPPLLANSNQLLDRF